MVGVGAAAACDDATSVVLEDSLIGLDGNGDGLKLKGGLEIGITAAGQGATALLHTRHGTSLQTNGTARRLAGGEKASLGNIRIRFLSADVITLGPFESRAHLTTTATQIGEAITVDILLL